MSSEYLKEIVRREVTSVFEETVGDFQETVLEYKEEIDRLRGVLSTFWKPASNAHRIDCPGHVRKDKEVPADQQFCNQEMECSMGQEEPELPQVQNEQGEPCTSQEGEPLVLMPETGTYTFTPTYEENDCSEDQTLYMKTGQSAALKSPVVGAANSELKHLRVIGDFTPHMRIQTGEKNPYKCETCGEHFRHASNFSRHMSIHTGEKPYKCTTCGAHFRQKHALKQHMRTHTGEKLYECKTCGEHFKRECTLKQHIRSHTDEKPYVCKACGAHFMSACTFKRHMRSHTGEKPYGCKTCGEHFRENHVLKQHMRIHR